MSEAQQLCHSVFEPLIKRDGKNERILLGPGNISVKVQDGRGQRHSVIHAGNHNYAGMYRLTDEAERLHQSCLDQLPLNVGSSSSHLENALQERIAQFFGTNFCYTTSTGYASNLLAFSAILNKTWLLIVDEHSHNSMHVGAYLSNVGQIIKFRHNDMTHAERILEDESHKWSNVLVAVEGLYSMEGTIPNVERLARLKAQYGFTLLADEAHSFGTLGHSGRGCIEDWNDRNNHLHLPLDLFDIRTAVLSKAFGAIGGVVCGTARFADCIRDRRRQLYTYDTERLNPAAMVQALHNLSQPSRLRRKLERLRRINSFMCQELTNRGIYVYGDYETPILPIHTARPSVAAKFAYCLRKNGVLANPISTPAVPFWQSRCRVALSADLDDASVDKLLKALVETAQFCGIIAQAKYNRVKFLTTHEGPDTQETEEARISFEAITDLISRDAAALRDVSRPTLSVIRAGHTARDQYGIAAGAPRWGSGTYMSHVDAERAIYNLTSMPEAIMYNDTYLGLMSTVAALSRPLLGYHKHYFLVPKRSCQAVLDGIKVAPKSGAPETACYTDVKSLLFQISKAASCKAYSSVYFESSTDKSKQDLLHLIASLARSQRHRGITLLMKDSQLPGSVLQKAIVVAAKECGIELLLFGSFRDSISLPGAFLSGGRNLISELRYTSRGYMFTTSQMPFIAAMIAEGLDEVAKRSILEA